MKNNTEVVQVIHVSSVECGDGISAPDEIHVLANGCAVAVHASYPDILYPSLEALKSAYRFLQD